MAALMTMALGATLTLGDASPVAALGERLLLQRRKGVGERRSTQLVLLDPSDGSEDVVWSADTDTWLRGFGGAQGAALLHQIDDADYLLSINSDGVATDVPLTEHFYGNSGAVGLGALWLSEGILAEVTTPLIRLDLETGAVTRVALPPGPTGLQTLVSGLQVLDDAVYVELYQAQVQSGGDFVSVGIAGYETWLYLPTEDTWWPQTTALPLLDVGVDSQGRVVGSVFSDAGRVLAAYDLAADDLLLSDQVCISDHYPTLSTGRTMWMQVDCEDEVCLQGITLE